MTEQEIKPESEICQVLSALQGKFLVDFANGIDVARDHITVQRERSGFFARCYDGFTGAGARRQANINATVVDGLEGTLSWLVRLTDSITTSNFAILQVNQRVSSLQRYVIGIANHSAATAEQLRALTQSLNERCDLLSHEVSRVDFEARAQRHLQQVFNKWRAGRFDSFSLAGRCYAALEELRWGDFGDYCRNNATPVRTAFLEDLVNQAVAQLKDDAGVGQLDRPGLDFWIKPPAGLHLIAESTEALRYLGDWYGSATHPFTYATTQLPVEFALEVPRLCSADRVAKALAGEVFEELTT